MRLTTKNQSGGYSFLGDTQSVINRLAELEDLEEQGRLAKLPCKLGSTIYDIYEFIENRCSPEILEYKAKTIEIGEDKHEIYFDIGSTIFRPDDFGKTVFLTKFEAEKALEREMGK